MRLHRPGPERPLPTPPGEIQRQLLRHVVDMAALLMVVLTAALGVVYALRGNALLASVEFTAMVVLALVWWRSRRVDDPMFGVQGLALAAWLVLAVVVVLHGGLRSPALLWLVMTVPLMAMAGAPLAYLLGAMSVAFVVGLYVAESQGWLLPVVEVPLAQRMVSAVLILALFFVFSRSALAWRNRIANELRQARDAAIEAAELKSRFIVTLNHELRTPLNAVVGSAQLLARAPPGPDREPLLAALDSASQHLLQLVNDVLDHSQLEAGMVQLEKAPFDIEALLREVQRMFAPTASAKGLRLELHIDRQLPRGWLGDAARLRQVLVNLVSNALKFTDRGGATLRAEPAATGLRLIVDDSGPGLPQAARARVFEPYVQEDASIGRRHGGSGLGLAICRDLIGLMGGRIEVRDGPAGGARFAVELPLARAELPPMTAAGAAGAVRPAAPGLHVLLVEDNAVNQMVTAAMLQRLGANVATAGDGEQALVCMAREHFDLVLMDLQMPRLDGLATARRRREQEARDGLPRLRIVALTGELREPARVDCQAAGMDGLLIKPVALDDLAALLAPASAGAA